MSLRTKLAILFSLLAIVPIIFLSVFSYVNQRSALVQKTISQLESVAEIQRKRTEEKLGRYIEQVNFVTSRTQLRISLDAYLRTGDVAEINRIRNSITDAKSSISVIDSIAVLSKEGRVLAATKEVEEGKNYAGEGFVPVGLQSNFLHDVFKDTDGIIKARLVGPLVLEGETVGIALIVAKAAPLLAVTEDYTGLGKTGEVLLAEKNKAGDALFLTPLRFDAGAALTRAIPKDKENIPIIPAVYGEEKVFLEDALDYRGEPIIAVTRTIPSLGWGLMAKIDRAEALAPIGAFAKTSATVALLSILVIVAVSYLQDLRTLQP